MFKLWRKIDSDRRLILTLVIAIMVMLLLNLLLWYGWLRAPKKLTVFVPPDLTQGASFAANDIPKHAIYAFSYYIWQLLNTWPVDGQDDYKEQLETLWPYLTADFKTQLEEDYEMNNAKGLLKRTRQIQGQTSAVYEPVNVIKQSDNHWHVKLVVRLTERLHDTVFKDTLIVYPLKVVRYPTPENYNPWGLALDGFYETPRRIESKVSP